MDYLFNVWSILQNQAKHISEIVDEIDIMYQNCIYNDK